VDLERCYAREKNKMILLDEGGENMGAQQVMKEG
jgi:hypothetical protein